MVYRLFTVNKINPYGAKFHGPLIIHQRKFVHTFARKIKVI